MRQQIGIWVAAAGLLVAGLAGTAAAQPVNDGCAQAIGVGEGTFNFTTLGATFSRSASCDDPGVSGQADVWFNYLPSQAGTAVVSTCGLVDSNFRTTVSVFSSCADGATELACNNNFCGEGQSTLAFTAAAGTHYLVRIASGDNLFPSGQFGITLLPTSNCTHPPVGVPPNDCCANATNVSEGSFAFTTVNATKDYAGQCDLLGIAGDVWFRYQATQSGFARIYPGADAPENTVIAVLDNSARARRSCAARTR